MKPNNPNVKRVIAAVRQGRVDEQTIALAQRTLENSEVDATWDTIMRAVAGANPAPRLKKPVNETLQMLLRAEGL
ncbi:hypothetical protein TFLX_06080 [Thermoflexales bacterium]|nr:hypothetical protein TFLX_06080 [Thermoflexales bacterium]